MITDAELIKAVEDIGDSIKANAIKIAGNHKYQTKLKIMATIPMDGAMPTIKVLHDFIPEMNVKTEELKGRVFKQRI